MKRLLAMLLSLAGVLCAGERNPFAADDDIRPQLVALIAAEQQRVAVLAWPDGRQQVMAVGERYRGLVLQSLSADSATIAHDGGSSTLKVGD